VLAAIFSLSKPIASSPLSLTLFPGSPNPLPDARSAGPYSSPLARDASRCVALVRVL